MKRVASHEAPRGEPRSAEHAVPGEGFDRVGGARWREAARRRQRRRDESLVAADGQDEELSGESAEWQHAVTLRPVSRHANRRSAAAANRTAPSRPRDAPGSRDPTPAGADARPGARSPSAGAANDCGPPRWTGIWVRS